MSYNDIYEMAIDNVITMWNKFCIEHDREKLVVYTMADWRREVADTNMATWFIDRLDPERFSPNHEYVAFDTCDDVWVSSDDIFDLVDVCLIIDETMEDLQQEVL